MENLIIRNEEERDRSEVERITRDAFWNHNAPGCDEHYLVHIMRTHEDFIPQLDFVAELDGRIIGNVMYTKALLIADDGTEKRILSFGPLTVAPEFQRSGVGKALLERSFEKARSLGYDTVVIFGHPSNYIARGFKSCKKYNVCVGDGIYPTALLVKELCDGALLPDKRRRFIESPVCEIDRAAAEEFDKLFEPREKEYRASQEEFFIYSHSTVS